ncbi:hypothetical protein EB061_00745 [bacterium]|nr:hypothetical protein [bacterium]
MVPKSSSSEEGVSSSRWEAKKKKSPINRKDWKGEFFDHFEGVATGVQYCIFLPGGVPSGAIPM